MNSYCLETENTSEYWRESLRKRKAKELKKKGNENSRQADVHTGMWPGPGCGNA